MRTGLLIALALGAVGCQRRTVGHFGEGAFYHARRHYRVRYTGAGESLLPARWRLTNYAHDDTGHPTTALIDVHGTETLDTAWFGGRGRARGFTAPRVDLHFRDSEADAEIWVRTMVIPRAWQHATPEAIMNMAVSTATDPSVPLDPLGSRFAPTSVTVRTRGAAQIDGRSAHWMELDVARGEVAQRVTVVGMRPGSHEWRWRRRRQFPMMLVFGFSSSAEEHESVRGDFEQLVSRVDIR